MNEKMNKNKKAFNAFSFSEFISSILSFIRNPRIVGKNANTVTSEVARRDFIASLLLTTAFLGFVKQLMPSLFAIDPAPTINSVYLFITVTIEALTYGFILTAIFSLLFIFKGRNWHSKLFEQVLRTYAVVNLPFMIIIALVIQRAITTQNMKTPENIWDFFVGGVLGVLVIVLIVWLLVVPLIQYIAHYYKNAIAIGFIFFIGIIPTYYSKAQIDFGIADNIINQKAFCKELFQYKKEKGEFKQAIDESCFIGKCVSNFSL